MPAGLQINDVPIAAGEHGDRGRMCRSWLRDCSVDVDSKGGTAGIALRSAHSVGSPELHRTGTEELTRNGRGWDPIYIYIKQKKIRTLDHVLHPGIGGPRR